MIVCLAANPSVDRLFEVERLVKGDIRALHYAVLHRNVELVRVLMQAGADPHKGIYPHRDATGALNLSTGIEVSVLELIEEIGLEHELAPARAGEIARSCLDPGAAN